MGEKAWVLPLGENGSRGSRNPAWPRGAPRASEPIWCLAFLSFQGQKPLLAKTQEEFTHQAEPEGRRTTRDLALCLH